MGVQFIKLPLAVHNTKEMEDDEILMEHSFNAIVCQAGHWPLCKLSSTVNTKDSKLLFKLNVQYKYATILQVLEE